MTTDQLWHTTNGAQSWSPVTLPEPMEALSGLAVSADGWLLAGGTTQANPGTFVLFRKRGARASWEKLDPNRAGYWGGAGQPYRHWFLGSLVIAGPSEALAAAFRGYEEGGVLLRTVDGGTTWKAVLTTRVDLYRVQLADDRHGWLTGSRGTLWRTTDAGATWHSSPSLEGVTASSLAFAPRGSVFGLAPLWKGKVLVTTTGQTWELAQVDLAYAMPSAAVVDPGWAYVLGANGRLAHYVNPSVKAPEPAPVSP
jgi:hypothetical protein